jgi:hypothetical protein
MRIGAADFVCSRVGVDPDTVPVWLHVQTSHVEVGFLAVDFNPGLIFYNTRQDVPLIYSLTYASKARLRVRRRLG